MQRISVQDIMTRTVIGANKDSTLTEIIRLMSEKKIGSVVILDKEKPIGIITTRHILKIAEKCIPPASLTAQEIMTQPLITINQDTNLRTASISMLKKGIKKLVVVDNEKLTGLVTTTDIERAFIPFNSPYETIQTESASSLTLREEFQIDMAKKTVEELMKTDIKTVNNLMKVSEIAKIMNKTKIGSLIVTKNEKAIGIVTDLHIVRHIMNGGLDPCSVKAEEAMEKLVTISPKDTLINAVEQMINNTVRKLGVIDSNDSLVGIITTTDFLIYYRSILFRQKILEK